MLKIFFPISVQHFLSIKDKINKIIYTEFSYATKSRASIMAIAVYKPKTIQALLFFIFFLLLIYKKLCSKQYISYKQISSNFITIKFILLISVFILEKSKRSYETINQILFASETNLLVVSNKNYLTSHKLPILIHSITTNCLASIYKIEAKSLISMLVSQLFILSIQPRNLLYSLNHIKIQNSIKSELNLIFIFSSQIYFLISDQITKIAYSFRIRSSHHTINRLLENKQIIGVLIFYILKAKDNLKNEVMTSAQLNSCNFEKAQYNDLKMIKILFYSSKILSILTILLGSFLLLT